MKKKRIAGIVIVIAILAMALSQTAFAAWTGYKTFKIPSGATFVHTEVNGARFSQTKATTVTTCSAEAKTATMWTNPRFRMHDYYYNPAGTEVTLVNLNTPYYATTTILKGAVAYAAVRSATTQIGDDYVEFKFSADG